MEQGFPKRIWPVLSQPLGFGICLLASAFVCYWIIGHFAIDWSPRRDIIGFSIHQQFNIDQVYWEYFLICLCPVLTWILYRPWARQLPENPLALSEYAAGFPLGLHIKRGLKLFFVGWVWSIPLLISLQRTPNVFLKLTLVAAGEYLLFVLMLAIGISKLRKSSFLEMASLLNGVAGGSLWLGLLLVSGATQVMEPSGTIRSLPWFPPVLSWGLCLVTLLWALQFLSRSKNDFEALENRLLYTVAIPVIVFFLHSRMIGGVPTVDYYHDGTGLVPSAGFLVGKVLWRDIVPIRGFLEDIFKYGIGQKLLEKSYWGAVNGDNLIVQPLCWVFTYYLNYFLFRKNIPFLLLVTFFLPVQFPNLLSHVSMRLMFLPIYLLFFAWTLAAPKKWKQFVFGIFSVVAFVLAPESIYAVFSCLLVGVARTFKLKTPSLMRSQLWTGLGLGTGTLGLGLFLQANGAWNPYVEYLLSFSGFRYMTGIPLILEGPVVQVAMLLPIITIALAVWWFGFGKNRLSDPKECLIAAMVVFVFFYYTKFLNRMDGHIFAVVAVTLPATYYLFEKFFVLAHSKIANKFPIHQFFAIALIFLFILQTPLWSSTIRDLSHAFRTTVPAKSEWRALGYYQDSPSERTVLRDFQTLFRTYLAPQDAVFDMTNQTGLFHYILGRKNAIPQHLIYLALNRRSQEHYVQELKRTMPPLVIYYFDGERRHWDGVPMMIRHYRVSEFLLQNYDLFVRINGYLIMKRRDLKWSTPSQLGIRFEGRVQESDLAFTADPCDWGYALEGSRVPSPIDKIQNPMAWVKPIGNSSQRLTIDFLSVSDGVFVISPFPKESSSARSQIRFSTRKGQGVRYEVPVSHCVQWWFRDQQPWHFWHDTGAVVRSIREENGAWKPS